MGACCLPCLSQRFDVDDISASAAALPFLDKPTTSPPHLHLSLTRALPKAYQAENDFDPAGFYPVTGICTLALTPSEAQFDIVIMQLL